ncbi:MAG: hypothetical protein OEW46_04080, partial [Actinomycetota bacterium]|nr:hypothetical protein [Actinomycetota bacterium]
RPLVGQVNGELTLLADWDGGQQQAIGFDADALPTPPLVLGDDGEVMLDAFREDALSRCGN